MHHSCAFAAYQAAQCDEPDPATMLRKYELEPAELRRVVEAIRERGLVRGDNLKLECIRHGLFQMLSYRL